MMDLAEKVFLELEVRGLSDSLIRKGVSDIIDYAFRI